MENVGYYNGNIGPIDQITMPISDRACYFGDGCYDATFVANGVIFALEEHLDRFYNSCRLLEIQFHLTREALTQELYKVVGLTDPGFAGMLYWQASRGTAPRGHAFPPASVKPNLMIFARPMSMDPMDKRLHLISLEDTRFLHCNIKTLNLLPSVMAYQRARERDCDEAVLHRGSRVTECAHSNILMIKDGALCSPPADELILPGITRKHLLELAAENGVPVVVQPFSMVELMNADEVIVSSSGALCSPVDTIDGIPVGGRDPQTLGVLQQAYTRKFKAETNQL